MPDMPDHFFQQCSIISTLCFQLAYPLINRGGEFVFFVNSPSAGNVNFARGNARCDRLQDFGVPKEAGIFLTQSIHLRAGRVHLKVAMLAVDPLLPLFLLLSMVTLSESLFIQTPRFNPVTRAVPSF